MKKRRCRQRLYYIIITFINPKLLKATPQTGV